MSRHEVIEAILRARYELETTEATEKPKWEAELWTLVDAARQGTPIARLDLLRALEDRYREYKRAQLLAQRRRLTI